MEQSNNIDIPEMLAKLDGMFQLEEKLKQTIEFSIRRLKQLQDDKELLQNSAQESFIKQSIFNYQHFGAFCRNGLLPGYLLVCIRRVVL